MSFQRLFLEGSSRILIWLLLSKKKNMNTKAVIEKEGDRIILSATFSVTPKEFGIKIPAIVKDKIADIINIIIAYELIEKK